MTSADNGPGCLTGVKVLVVDDDYYQATDTERFLADAGASVVGPFGHTDDALAAIENASVACAVVDLNLGDGPRFDLSRRLMARNIPVLIVSGYDALVLPADLAGLRLLVKPVPREELVRAVADLLSSSQHLLKSTASGS